jgi:hypothetical protein
MSYAAPLSYAAPQKELYIYMPEDKKIARKEYI